MAATDAPVAPPPHGAPNPEAPRKKAPRWSKVAIAVAALLIVLGLVLELFAGGNDEMRISSTGGGANLVDAQGNPLPGQEPAAAEPDWAPGFLKMGFSFFVCFAIGYAARKFLKVGLVVLGVVFAIYFLGAYLSILELKLDVMEAHWDDFWARARTQFERFKAFVTGSRPAAGLGALGLVAGFKQG